LDSFWVWNIFNAELDFYQDNDSVSFTNLSTNYESLVWDFGDGVTSFDENPNHLYTTSGNYTITLSALTNGGCLLDTSLVTISVSVSTDINELTSKKVLLNITDILGRTTNAIKNTHLFYHFNNGTVEKKIIIE
jgi:PKD repeat protein